MGAQGTATLNFGAFPGASDASVAVTGQAGIVGSSLVEAWIRPVATADHTDTEHMLETFQVFAADIVAGTGFTVYGFNTSQTNEGLTPGGAGKTSGLGIIGGEDGLPRIGGIGTRIYGQWAIAWVWN